MTIKEVEKQVGITSANIRFYEKEGLLVPGRNKANNYREYEADDVEKLKKIKVLRMLGFAIEDVKKVLDGGMELNKAAELRMEQIKKEEEHLKEVETVCRNIISNNLKVEQLDDVLFEETPDVWREKLNYIMKADISEERVPEKKMNNMMAGYLLYFLLVNAVVSVVCGEMFLTKGGVVVGYLIVSVIGTLAVGWSPKPIVQGAIYQILTFLFAPAVMAAVGMFQTELPQNAGVKAGILFVSVSVFVVIFWMSVRKKRTFGKSKLLLTAGYSIAVGVLCGYLIGNYVVAVVAMLVADFYVHLNWYLIDTGQSDYNKYYVTSSVINVVNIIGTMMAMKNKGSEWGYGRWKE